MTDDSVPNPTGSSRFERILTTVEQQLRLSLAEARDTTSHPGDKGANVEIETRTVHRKYLPPSFGVGHGKVYDAYGDESAQAEVVITTPEHPFSYPPEGKAGAYIIEGVGAVGEVKSVLTAAELDRAIAAARNSNVSARPSRSATRPIAPR